MRGSSDWLPVFWLLVGFLLAARGLEKLRPWARRKWPRKPADDESLEDAAWTQHSHSEN